MLSKKLFVILLILFSLSLAACLPSGEQPSGPAGQPPTGATFGQGQAAGGQSPQGQLLASRQLSGPAGSPASGSLPQGQPPAQVSQSGQPATSSPVTQAAPSDVSFTYTIVDTGQTNCYDNQVGISCPQTGQSFSGQDAQYAGNQPHYTDNGDGTITDNVTGLMWQKDPGPKKTYTEAVAGANPLTLGGYNDWRLPTIKELYSLILFSGLDVSPCMGGGACNNVPFIDTAYFNFEYGNTAAGERIIDAQYWSGTEYVSATMGGAATVFGVNFADGRIKGYPRDTGPGGTPFTEFVRYVRGNPNYGINNFSNNGNGTIVDQAAGLTWMQVDSGAGMKWQDSLAYCQNLSYAGFDDWRLPNAKELQSIVDYSRSPATTNSAAINPLFNVTAITAEDGQTDYPFYWTGTTHATASGRGDSANYISFGEALGYMRNAWIDVHGAGAQRSDPKTGSSADYPQGHGPQGDAVRVNNYVRCVRDGGVVAVAGGSFNPAGQSSVASPPGGGAGQPLAGASLDSQGGGIGQQPPAGSPPQGGAGQPPDGRTPPQEAIDACNGVGQGNTCDVTTPRGTLTGTCMPIANQLACVPQGGPPSGRP